ncbi:MAG: hypothetical protein ABSA49_08050, partial [Rhizomicrobium sp.]
QFLRDSDVDIVLIFSPRRKDEHSARHHNNPRLWNIDIFDKWQRSSGYYDRLDELRELLPNPYLHGYQARSWMQQRMLHPQARGQYLQSSWGGHNVKISARALLEMLAGRMSEAEFKRWITGDHNPFEHWLSQGYSISEIEIEPQGSEADDDYIVVKLAPDANASALRLPPQLLDSPIDKK